MRKVLLIAIIPLIGACGKEHATSMFCIPVPAIQAASHPCTVSMVDGLPTLDCIRDVTLPANLPVPTPSPSASPIPTPSPKQCQLDFKYRCNLKPEGDIDN
jgi:hypothetical protein